jgi:hypothetical protein
MAGGKVFEKQKTSRTCKNFDARRGRPHALRVSSVEAPGAMLSRPIGGLIGHPGQRGPRKHASPAERDCSALDQAHRKRVCRTKDKVVETIMLSRPHPSWVTNQAADGPRKHGTRRGHSHLSSRQTVSSPGLRLSWSALAGEVRGCGSHGHYTGEGHKEEHGRIDCVQRVCLDLRT